MLNDDTITQEQLAKIALWEDLVVRFHKTLDERLANGAQIEAGPLKINSKGVVIERWWVRFQREMRRAPRVCANN